MAQQKIVSIEISEDYSPSSEMFANDPDLERMGGNDEPALPLLLAAGWRIVQITPLPSDNRSSAFALVLLEKH